MTVYLKTGVNQLTQAVANFHPENRPYLLLTACLISGWAASAKIVDYISRTYPFAQQIKTPLSIAGSFAVAGLSHFRPKTGVATMVILSIIAFALNRFKPTYSSEVFKKLLLEGYKFPPNVTVMGDLDFNGTLITSLPVGLVVNGSLNLSYSSIRSLPVGLVVNGNLDLSHTPITSLPERLVIYGDLDLSSSHITSLPAERLVIHGDLELFGTPITSLPEWITTLGLRSDGGTRQIDLVGTKLSEDIINTLRATSPGIQFYFFKLLQSHKH